MRASTRLKLGYLGVAALDTWLAGSSHRGARAARFVTKPALMPLLTSSFATSRRAFPSPLRTTTLVAQAFGWGGDIALLGHGTRAFAIGAGSFGAGHAAYISGFVRQRADSSFLRAPATRAALRLWGLAGPVMALAAARQERALGPAVLGYTGLLAGTFATGSHLSSSLPASARRLTALGAGLFLASDTVLGFRQLVLPLLPVDASPRLDAALERAVMGTYTAAQLLLAEGAARAWNRRQIHNFGSETVDKANGRTERVGPPVASPDPVVAGRGRPPEAVSISRGARRSSGRPAARGR